MKRCSLGGMVDCKWMDGYQFAANGGLSNKRKAGGKDVFQRQLDEWTLSLWLRQCNFDGLA